MRGSSKDGDLFLPLPEIPQLPLNVDRRSFLMRNAAIGAAAVMTGAVWTPEARAQQATKEAAAAPPLGATLSPNLDIVRQSKGPVMTVLEEFYKVGPGPSSSHTIGPMRITYDFYQRCTKLPPDQLAQATGLKVLCSAA
jgi:L-serine dehydratase